MKTNKLQTQVGIAVLLTASFFGLLVISLWYYALVDIFLIGLVIALLRKYEVKRVLLLLSPIIVYPLILALVIQLPSSIWNKILSWGNAGTPWAIIIPIIVGLIYAYLFRDAFTKWIEPTHRMLVSGLMCLMLVVSIIVAPVIRNCEIISASEKGVTSQEVNGCKALGLYHGGVNRFSLGMAEFVAIYTFVPTAIILLGMTLQYIRRRKESAR